MMPVAVKTGLDKAGLSFGKEVTWFVTFVEEKSGLFYMQLADPSISVKYERLYQEIEGAVVGGKVHEFGSPPEIGGLCIAQYTEDEQWYRGQILSIDPEDDEAEIYFIDYGNGESMNWRALRMMPQGFSELPSQAFQCRLANIEPVGGIWSKEAIELLKELISERELIGSPTHLCKTGAVVVKLFADEDKSVMVAQQLVMAGFAHWKKTKSSVSQSSSSASASSSSSNALSVNVKPGQLGQIKVKPESFIDLCISYIENLDDFHCQPVQHSDSLNAMIEEMQSFYNSSQGNDLRITSPNVDQLCCAKFSGDGVWYRSTVRKISGGGKYEVMFLDFGNTEVLPVSEIRELSPKFKQLPVVGLHCCLYRVSPANGGASFSDDACARFEELTSEKQLVGNVKKVEDSGKVNLILLDTTSSKEGLDLNEELAKTGHVVYTDNLDVSLKQSDSSQSAAQGTVQPHFVSVAIEKGAMEVGWVAFASTPFDFYCQLERNSDNLENMMQELNDEYAKLKPGENTLQTFQPGVPCCAKYSGDGRFYRAELKSIEKTNAVVHFVDYGNEEQCRADELKHLRKEYLKLPKQAIKCKLAAIQAPASGTFPTDVSARFNDMVMDKEFNLTFITVDSNGFNKVSLIEKNDTNVMTFDVAKSLAESGLVSKVTATSKGDQGQIITNKRYTELQVALDDYIDVIPTVVTDPNQFCCQLLENADEIDTMMAELEETYRDSKPNNNVQLKNGMPCVALYPDDNAWYRAVLARLSGREAEVTYVDFGNTEKIPSANIRPIHAKLMTLPAQTFVCSLFNVEPQGSKDWSKSSIEAFSNLVLEQQLIACVKRKDQSNMHHVELLDTTSNRKQQISIAEVIIEKGFAVSLKGQQSQPSDAESASNNATSTSNAPSSAASSIVPSIAMKPGAVENVYVAHVDDLDNIYCQLARCEDDLNNLMVQIGEKAPSLGKLSTLKASQPVCAKYSADDEWYRGEIISVVDSQTANVRFIDYGNSENVNISSMREISSELLKEPKYAVQCSLDHGGLKWKDNAVEEFLGKTTDKVLKMAVKDAKAGKFVIELRDDTDASVASNLVITNQSSVSHPNEAAQVRPKQQNEAVSNNSFIGFPESKIRCDVEIGFYVSHVNSLSDFYIQDASQSDPLDELMQQLENTQKQTGFFKTAKPGMACMAEFSEDSALYRAVVDSVKGSTVLVRFVDYGNTEEKSLNDLYPLPGDLLKTTPFAVKCCLKGAISTLSANDLEKFKEATFDRVLKGSLRRLNSDKYELTMSEKSITSTYCKSVNEAQPSLQHIQTSAGSSLDCYVSHTESLNEFYVQPSKYEADLDKVVEKMTHAGSNPAVSGPSVGQFCCAKFSEDEQWYRGEITGQSGDKFKVLFVDYGNSETVGKTDLKVLPADMLAIPCLSIPCTLDVAPGQAQADIDKFVSETADQILSAEFVGKKANGRNTVTLKLDGKQLFSAAKKGPELHVAKPEPNLVEPRSNAQSPAVIVEFNETSVPFGAAEQAIVSYVVTPQEFYCQLDKNLTKLDEVMDKLEGHYRCLGPSENRLKSMVPGVPCAAKYSGDDAWYRASLECLESATHAKIKFVDYGNVESIAIADVKELTEELQQEPMFAVKCSLVGDVGPTSEFENRVLEQTFEITVTGRNGSTHMVDLLKDGHSLSKELSGKNPPAAVTKLVQESSVQYKDVDMKPGDKQKVYFVDGASPSEFYCHLVKHEAEFVNLMNDIASDAGGLSDLGQLVKGKPCIGMFSEDGGWYRGRILDTKPGEARVFFVDYGNEEWVSNDNIKVVPDKFMQLPIQAVLCSLNGVKPASVSWSPSETELLKDKCADKVMLLGVIALENGKYSVVLEDTEKGEKVNDAFEKPRAKSVVEKNESKAVASTLQFKDHGISKGMKLAVTCTFIESADKISCQWTKYLAQLGDLMADIATYCNGNAKGVASADIGMPCLALFSEDNTWYRANVTVVNGASISVTFVDYGNEAEVKKDQLREIRQKDIELPVTCFDCQIPGIALTDDAMMCIEELCLEQELMVEVKDVVKAGLVIGDICKVDSGESITKIVQGKFPSEASNFVKSVVSDVAPQNQKQLQYLKPNLNIGDTENIMCSHITSVNIVECHLSKYSEKFNPMMDKIAEYCDANTTVLKDPKVRDPCLAKYPVDGGWYRATILSVSSNVLKLRYVDYGNEDEVSLADTREITEEFMALPTLSLTCKLHDVHIEDLDAVKGKEWLENSCCNIDYNIGVISKSDEGIEVNMYYPDTEETLNDELYSQFALEEEAVDAPVEEKPTPSLEVSQKAPTENADEEKSANLENAESSARSQEAALESPSEQLRLSSADVELSVKIPAMCLFIDADLNIHCQPTKYSTDLDQLMAHIGDYCAEITTKPDSYESGVPCFAMFPDDQEWYRAEIVQKKDDMIEVFYVDFGNSGLVKKEQILAMGKAFTTMPKASVACSLEGLDKISCPSDDVKAWLEEKILEQQIDFEIKEIVASGRYKADLYIDGKSIMDLLTSEMGQSVTESNNGKSLTKSEVKNTDLKGSGGKEEKVFKFEFPALSVQSTKAAHCTHIDSLQKVYCQLLEYQSQLDDIGAKMINYCEDSSKGPANCSVGCACLAQCPLDEQWYRAKVLEVQNDSVKVQFVDYGNTAMVSLQNTRVANEEFTSLPATVVKCQLHDVHNEDLDVKAAVQWLQENVVEHEVKIEVAVVVVDGVHDCVFTKQGLEGTINDELYALFEVGEEEPTGEGKGVASENAEGASENAEGASENSEIASERTEVASESKEDASENAEGGSENAEIANESAEVASESTESVSESTEGVSESTEGASKSTDIEPTSANGSEVDVQANETENVETEEQAVSNEVENKNGGANAEEICCYTYEDLEMGCKETVRCLHAESTQLLYCQLNRIVEKFHDILGKINEYCDGEGLVPNNIKKGLACFAKWKGDTTWYRVEVTEVINDREVKVFYVDFGHSDVVLISDTRVMKKEFIAIPALTIKCQLHDVHESDLDPYAIERWLHDDFTANGSDMVCEVVGKIDDRYDCILTFKGDEGTVNDELYEKFELHEANEDDNGASNNDIVSNSGSDVLLSAPVSIASVTSSETEAKSADNAELDPGANEFVPPVDKVVPAIDGNTLDPAAGEFVPTDGPSSKTKLAVSSRNISVDTSLVMHLSSVNSPSSFWCQFDDTGDDLIQLMVEIEEVYSVGDIPSVTSVPEVGSFCCAQFSQDEQWYRGEVIERCDADSCLVKFIDYGNVEKTDLGIIKELKPEFFVLKKQAVECSLHGVKATADGGQWLEDAIAEFENMCTQELKVNVIHKEGERLDVVIKIVENDINVNQTMIEKGLGNSDVTKTNGAS